MDCDYTGLTGYSIDSDRAKPAMHLRKADPLTLPTLTGCCGLANLGLTGNRADGDIVRIPFVVYSHR